MGACIISLTRFHDAYGLGLSYDGSWSVKNASLTTWTESDWSATRMRTYLAPIWTYQWMQLGVGLGLTTLFSLGTNLIRRQIRQHLKTD